MIEHKMMPRMKQGDLTVGGKMRGEQHSHYVCHYVPAQPPVMVAVVYLVHQLNCAFG
jgi:hypothetical protein